MSIPDEWTWSDGEIEVLARAAIRAPSAHTGRPWSLSLPGRRAELREQNEPTVSEHDATARDGLIYSGAALANLVLAVRVLGWAIEVEIPTERGRLVAAVAASGREPPSERELHEYAAIPRRRTYRRPFAEIPVASSMLPAIVGRLPDGIGCRVLRPGEEVVLAALFERASRTSTEGDAAVRREIEDWIGDRSPGTTGRPWAGIIGRKSRDTQSFARRLAAETLVIFCAEDDGRAGRVRAGTAMQRSWLAAVDGGLVASVLTRLPSEESLRAWMAAEMTLPGRPLSVMRLGYPDGPAHQAAPPTR
ncbi:nitroreductase [Amycolatopsis azurea]|uniref:nitroreductase n=1 Tax=Amycolatopsis azurea TaxID=36819 RepID=UPI00380997AA